MNAPTGELPRATTSHDTLVVAFSDAASPLDIGGADFGIGGLSNVVEVVSISPRDLQDPARLAGVALQSEEVKRLVCIGAGTGGLAALAAGRLLGAHAVLAIAPSLGIEGSEAARLDETLYPLFNAGEFAWPGQTVDLVQTTDSVEGDRAFAGHLSAAGAKVRVGHSHLPSRLLPLALRHSRWFSAWLAAYPLEPADLASAWRATFDYGIEVDLDGADPASGEAVTGLFRIRNRGPEPIDLAAAAADGVRLGVRRERPLTARPGAEASSALPSVQLSPGEAKTLEVTLPPLAATNDAFGVGLIWRQDVWLADFGFSAVRLESQPSPPVASRPQAAAGPARRPAALARSAGLADRSATREDVMRAYRSFLGREVESETVIADQLKGGPGLWALVDRVMSSRESVRWRIHEAATRIADEPDEDLIALDATPDQAARIAACVDAMWTQAGREQPYFSTLANPDYRLDRLTPKTLEAFYATGEAEVAALEGACRRSGVDLPTSGSVLDLGCRVGRVGVALAKRFSRYTGVDLSPDQLACAQAHSASHDGSCTQWLRYDAWLADGRDYDALFSVLALQHLPPPMMLKWLASGLAHVRPGGLAYVQLPCRLFDYSFDTGRYLDGRPPSRPYDLHALPQPVVLAAFARHGFAVLEVQLSPRIGSKGLSYAFLAQRQPLQPTAGGHDVGVCE